MQLPGTWGAQRDSRIAGRALRSAAHVIRYPQYTATASSDLSLDVCLPRPIKCAMYSQVLSHQPWALQQPCCWGTGAAPAGLISDGALKRASNRRRCTAADSPLSPLPPPLDAQQRVRKRRGGRRELTRLLM